MQQVCTDQRILITRSFKPSYVTHLSQLIHPKSHSRLSLHSYLSSFLWSGFSPSWPTFISRLPPFERTTNNQSYNYHNSCTFPLDTLFRVENGVQLCRLEVEFLVVTPAAPGLNNQFHSFPRAYQSQIPSLSSLSENEGSFPYYYEIQFSSPILVALAATSSS